MQDKSVSKQKGKNEIQKTPVPQRIKEAKIEQNLDEFILWITEDEDAVWVEMEQRACPKYTLRNIALYHKNSIKKCTISNDWIKERMRTWSTQKKPLNISTSVSRARKSPDFRPHADAGLMGVNLYSTNLQTTHTGIELDM